MSHSRPVESLFAPVVNSLAAYEPPDWTALAGRAGLPPAALLRLDANENPYPLSPRAVQALAGFDGYGYYPDYRRLGQALAGHGGVRAENVVPGNGGDEMIDLAVRLFVPPGEAAIVCPPAFDMYTVSLQAHGGRAVAVPRCDDWQPDMAAIEAAVDQVRPRLLFLTSPGNPDGQPIPLATIRRLLDLPLAVVVDEAYVEFGGQSAVPLLAEHDNLLILRTMSKWAGMAGLRLGYALAAPAVAAALHRLRPPYNVNAAAAVAALAVLDDVPYADAVVGRIVAERERLAAALAALPGVAVVPGQANFVLCRLAGRSGRQVAGALAGRGILVRSFGPDNPAGGPPLADALRITVGRPEQNDALLAGLAAVLQVPLTGGPAPAHGSSLQPGGRPGRAAEIRRRTGETEVAASVGLDGSGRYRVDTGVGFLDHMLAQVAAHGLLDLDVQARGDLEVDEHHTVEDVAIALGQALDAALGERRALVRMAHAYAPLDEALARVVVDLSGRPYAVVDVHFDGPRLGTMDSDLVIHFLESLAVHARLSLHAHLLSGRNDHHRAEALFKALGRALGAATRLDERRPGVPSTKGVL